MPAPTDHLPDPVAVLASTLHLTTQYARTGCVHGIPLIQRQLAYLKNHPDGSLPPYLTSVASLLAGDWEAIAFAQSAFPAQADSPSSLRH